MKDGSRDDWTRIEREIRRSNWRAFSAGVILASLALVFVHWMGWS